MKMHQKGAIPIPYIIALVLAILVIAIIVYWLFFSSGDFADLLLEKGCDAKKMSYCNDMSTTSTFSAPCASITDTNRDDFYAPECCPFEKFHGPLDSIC